MNNGSYDKTIIIKGNINIYTPYDSFEHKTTDNMLLNNIIKPCNECKFYPLCGGLCPLALLEGTPRCPSFTYNMEDRIFIDFLAKNRIKR